MAASFGGLRFQGLIFKVDKRLLDLSMFKRNRIYFVVWKMNVSEDGLMKRKLNRKLQSSFNFVDS